MDIKVEKIIIPGLKTLTKGEWIELIYLWYNVHWKEANWAEKQPGTNKPDLDVEIAIIAIEQEIKKRYDGDLKSGLSNNILLEAYREEDPVPYYVVYYVLDMVIGSLYSFLESPYEFPDLKNAFLRLFFTDVLTAWYTVIPKRTSSNITEYISNIGYIHNERFSNMKSPSGITFLMDIDRQCIFHTFAKIPDTKVTSGHLCRWYNEEWFYETWLKEIKKNEELIYSLMKSALEILRNKNVKGNNK